MALVSPVEAPVRISNAIRKASEATGVDFDYLLATAARESNFRPQAKAKTSSAAGLFQFIEGTWLQTVKEDGGHYGLEKYSPHIFRTERGRYTVPNPKIRSEILALRHNPEISALMAGAFTRQNADYVSSKLGRNPTQGELYIAHFLGADGATKLITLASKDPNARADAHFPRAAHANKPIFYSHGQARSVQQVYDQLVSDHSRFESVMMAASSPGRSRPPPSKAQAESVMDRAAVPGAGLTAQTLTAADNADSGRQAKTLPEMLTRKSPPLVSLTRVASLAEPPIQVAGETTMDAGPGAIGPWHTIVTPGATMSHEAAAASSGDAGEPQPQNTGLHKARPRQASAASGKTIEHSLGSPHRAIGRFLPVVKDNIASRFWELQALYGS